jgi:hypothetical protein
MVSEFKLGPALQPAAAPRQPKGKLARDLLPRANGGTNIPGGAAVADPETGILYVASTKACSAAESRACRC